MEGEGSVIRNREALTEEFLPERMFSRDGQLQQMAQCLAPIAGGSSPRSMMLYGPPGTGKTCMSRYVLSQLSEQASFHHAYVNCWNFETRFKILFSILQKIGADPSKHRVGTPIDEIIEALARKARSRQLVVILDEVDRVSDEKAVYDLVELGACVIMIANNETATYKWDPRIRSRLSSAERIAFPKYRHDELEGILKDRAEWALMPGSISLKEIVRIAERASGDARAAIAALRAAAEKAEAAGAGKVTADMLSEPSGRKDRQAELNRFQIAAVTQLKKGPLPSGELLELITKMTGEPVAERTFRKYMEELVRLGMVRAEGEGRWRRYSVS
ncbi:MAG: AAA family ATPase [Candidatus Aenigmarchaeota archaeon]|nr:AAA family ATPase [Candidatus Aenigmarchaeota archaeon]